RGLCTGHYQQQKAGKPLHTLRHPRPHALTLTTLEMLRSLSFCARGDANHAIPAAGALKLSSADLPIDPYVLGCWLGDGTSGSAPLTTAAPEIIAEISRAGGSVSKPFGKKGSACSYFIGGRRDSAHCRRGHEKALHGSGGHCRACQRALRRSARSGIPAGRWSEFSLHEKLRAAHLLHNKHIPQSYLRASVAQRLALFQGLMDTDGCVDKRKNVCEFTNTNKQLIDGFIELALGLGIVVVVKEGRSRLNGKDCGPKWR